MVSNNILGVIEIAEKFAKLNIMRDTIYTLTQSADQFFFKSRKSYFLSLCKLLGHVTVG